MQAVWVSCYGVLGGRLRTYRTIGCRFGQQARRCFSKPLGLFAACVLPILLSQPHQLRATEFSLPKSSFTARPQAVATSGNDANKHGVTRSDFSIRESGYWTCEGTLTRCIYWIDNERVIFNGARPDDIEIAADGRRTWRHAIYIWNLKTDQVEKYADSTRAALCYADGYVRYSRIEGEDIVVLAGRLGNEVETQRVRKGTSGNTSVRDSTWNTELSCGSYRPLQPPHQLPGRKLALREGHGFLYLGTIETPRDRQEPLLYFQHQSAAGIRLPILRWQARLGEITTTPFRNSYLIYPDQIDGRSDRCLPEGFSQRIYRLMTDGKVEAIHLPSRKEIRCHIDVRGFTEVRTGITARVNTGRLSTSGLHLVRGDSVTNIVQGWTSNSNVSPDGCRMAVGVSSPSDPRKPVTAEFNRGHLKVIDFCAKRGM